LSPVDLPSAAGIGWLASPVLEQIRQTQQKKAGCDDYAVVGNNASSVGSARRSLSR
jgi:hypothetical protein